ncbi:MAG TPA: ferric reductase-like transmembrane domain-containing protein [Candidatus Polarisedimenticolaceae bacterium]|nr:ferric reductase-like transmembrane domain-containing protein [Candidatus Polarisedimenticolaceae bacterium]
MQLILRGAAGLGLYLLLLLLPLLFGTAFPPSDVSASALLNLSVGLAYVGFAVMVLELSLVSRVQRAASPFGLDVLQQFHKEIGIAAFCLLLTHPILLVVAGYPARILGSSGVPWSVASGTLAFLLLLALISLSIWRKRLRLSYEIWLGTHGLLALGLLVVAGVHVATVGRFVRRMPMAVLCLLYVLVPVCLFAFQRLLRPLFTTRRAWRVVENRAEAGDARTLRLEPVGHAGWAGGFAAGQFAWLRLGRSPLSYDQHPISLSSSGDAAQETREIAFTIKNLGDWSGPRVRELGAGDLVWVDGPYGVFTLDREQGPGYVFLAGGVGITPLRSMLVTMAEREDVRPVVLFYAARTPEDLIFREDLLALRGRMNLKVVYVVSEAPPGWEGEEGRITAEVLRRHLPPKQYRRWQYFICGPSPMMDALEQILPDLGVPEDHIHTERFDMV